MQNCENKENKNVDVKEAKIDGKKHMSFEADIVKVKKDDCTKDTTHMVDTDSGESTPIVKCGGGGGSSKYFAQNASDTDEYDEKEEDGDYIPDSQMRCTSNAPVAKCML